MLEALDFYCERLNDNFWAEPLNALSNAAIFIAGLLGLFDWFKQKSNSWLFCLSVIVVFTSFGSFLFHTYANHLTMWFDILPIAIFMYLFLYFAATRHLLLKRANSLMLVGLLFLATVYLQFNFDQKFINGSAPYLPALTCLFYFSFRVKNTILAKGYQAASLVFSISLIFRTIDNSMCLAFPLGTHFLWHTLNGLLLFILLNLALASGVSEPHKS